MPLKKSIKLKKPSCTIFLMKIVYGPFYRGWPSLGKHYYFDRNYENELGRGGFGVVFKGHDKRVSILKFIFFF